MSLKYKQNGQVIELHDVIVKQISRPTVVSVKPLMLGNSIIPDEDIPAGCETIRNLDGFTWLCSNEDADGRNPTAYKENFCAAMADAFDVTGLGYVESISSNNREIRFGFSDNYGDGTTCVGGYTLSNTHDFRLNMYWDGSSYYGDGDVYWPYNCMLKTKDGLFIFRFGDNSIVVKDDKIWSKAHGAAFMFIAMNNYGKPSVIGHFNNYDTRSINRCGLTFIGDTNFDRLSLVPAYTTATDHLERSVECLPNINVLPFELPALEYETSNFDGYIWFSGTLTSCLIELSDGRKFINVWGVIAELL